MPLVYKCGKLFFLRQISIRARLIFSFFTLLIFTSIWFVFFYYPLFIKNKNAVLQLNKLVVLQKVFKKNIKKIPLLEKELIKLRADLNILNKSKDGLQFVLDNLKKFDLICKSVEPGKIKNKHEFQKEYFTLKIKGEFEKLIGYLNFVQKNLRLIRFKEIDFKINKKNQIKALSKLRFIKLKKDE